MVIHILPPQLANQIAAGEVVDRPASIIKELVENSIDAGATRIDIDIEQGGCKLIRVRDNGCGINKEELALALARHATSKIQNFDDLTAIESLGFRGEALASISSISRLTLTSKTQEQQEAWQVYAEGRDMTPTVKPASHPIGSTVEVLDIFYNTPARRRFLKTEKTEFSHIDEVIRRIALAYPKVSFHLSHNGKSIRQYRAIESEEWLEERISKICGISFTQKGIRLSWQHDDLSIEGWIAGNSLQEPRHYFYVNGRVVKDRLLNHALKQAFLECRQSTIYSTDDSLNYVIYLSIDPKQVDVNVHPAKHEVRFHEARLVHDFVYEAMRMALSEQQQQQQLQEQKTSPQTPTNQFLQQNRQAAGDNIFQKSVNSFSKKESSNEQHLYHQRPDQPYSQTNHLYGKLISSSNNQLEEEKEQYVSIEQKAVIESLFPKRDRSLVQNNDILFSNSETVATLGKVLTIIDGKYLLLERKINRYSLHILSIKMAKQQIFRTKIINNGQYGEQLLMPLSILLDKNEWQVFNQAQELLQSLNFQFETDKLTLKLMAVPKIMRNLMWQSLLIKMIKFIEIHLNETALQEQIIDWLFEQFWQESSSNSVNTLPDAIALMAEIEQLDESECDFKMLIKPIDLSVILSQFGFE